MHNFYESNVHLYIDTLDTDRLFELNNVLITVIGMGKPHIKLYNQALLESVKHELIKRNLLSHYVLDYRGRL